MRRFAVLFALIASNNAILVWLFGLHDTVMYRGNTIYIKDFATPPECVVQSVLVAIPFAIACVAMFAAIEWMLNRRSASFPKP